jgi:hypothetical protein
MATGESVWLLLTTAPGLTDEKVIELRKHLALV